MSVLNVGSVVDGLLQRFPPSWAEPWDRIGLVGGSSEWDVETVVIGLDVDADTVSQATSLGAELLVTHHPPFIADIGDLVRPSGFSANAWDAVTNGTAVASFHTNLDRAPDGATALARAIGLADGVPLEDAEQDVDLVVVYVPESHADDVMKAMVAAGAGRIGMYEECAFQSSGTGGFTPLPGSSPTAGDAGLRSVEDEIRLEMVASAGTGSTVARQAADAHPYEEPVVLIQPTKLNRGIARLGRLTLAPDGLDVEGLARMVGGALGCTPRIWGDMGSEVSKVATAGGSASSLVGHALAAEADALVCGEVRYHDALEALQGGMAVIEAGHDLTEVPLVGVLEDAVREVVGDGARIVVAQRRGHWTTLDGA